MAPRKTRKANLLSVGETDGQLSKEQRDQKKQLFMQQFEKEAQERINEMESKMEEILATVDRVFRVELMKMPPQLQNTLIKDLMREDNVPAGEVTIAIQAESPLIHQPLTRKSSKKVQMSESATRRKRMLSVQSKKAAVEVTKQTTKSRSMADLSTHVKNSRAASTATAKRTRGRVAKVSDPTAMSTRFLSSVGLGASGGDEKAGLQLVSPTATISTSCGETLCLSDDVKDHINVDMLDDTAVHQMQKLMQLMDYLCNKFSQQQPVSGQ